MKLRLNTGVSFFFSALLIQTNVCQMYFFFSVSVSLSVVIGRSDPLVEAVRASSDSESIVGLNSVSDISLSLCFTTIIKCLPVEFEAHAPNVDCKKMLCYLAAL